MLGIVASTGGRLKYVELTLTSKPFGKCTVPATFRSWRDSPGVGPYPENQFSSFQTLLPFWFCRAYDTIPCTRCERRLVSFTSKPSYTDRPSSSNTVMAPEEHSIPGANNSEDAQGRITGTGTPLM